MRRDDELLSAYVDGVTELTADERRRVEELLVRDPALRTAEAQTREVLDRLRSLPTEGTEPDWTAMERAIRDEVGPAAPRPWWRPAWRWLVPATALALAAAVFALWIQDRAPSEPPIVSLPADAGTPVEQMPPVVDDNPTMSLYLDGAAVELDVDDAALFEDDESDLEQEDELTPGLLPVDNLAWIDDLDVDDIEVADAWLGRKKG